MRSSSPHCSISSSEFGYIRRDNFEGVSVPPPTSLSTRYPIAVLEWERIFSSGTQAILVLKHLRLASKTQERQVNLPGFVHQHGAGLAFILPAAAPFFVRVPFHNIWYVYGSWPQDGNESRVVRSNQLPRSSHRLHSAVYVWYINTSPPTWKGHRTHP